MGDAANVRAIHALDELRAALGNFSASGTATLSVMNRELQRAREWVQECQRDWQRELRVREQAFADAQRALSSCQRSGQTDKEGRYHAPDCSRQEAAAHRAKAAIEEAHEALKVIASQSAHIEVAANDFVRSAHSLTTMFGSELAQGSALLAASVRILTSYTSGGSSGSASVGASAGAAPQSFTNTLAASLTGELEDARSVGFQPLSPQKATDTGFQHAVNDGTIKWVVDQGGVLYISPKVINRHEISHAALAGGRPVLAAGEADIAAYGDAIAGIILTNRSGHYLPSAASIDIGKQAFGRLGIVFETIELFG